MASRHLATLGDLSQLESLIRGPFLYGRRERRIALVGRSNVGKSSLMNALLDGTLARVSKQPGKTRQIHFYHWEKYSKILADLPGYGFAKTGHEERDRWAQFINAYLRKDEELERAVVLLDSRHGPTDLDADAIRFLSLEGVPLLFVFTKVDQLKTQSERAKRKKEAHRALLDLGFDPQYSYWVSTQTRVDQERSEMKKLILELASEQKMMTVMREDQEKRK